MRASEADDLALSADLALLTGTAMAGTPMAGRGVGAFSATMRVNMSSTCCSTAWKKALTSGAGQSIEPRVMALEGRRALRALVGEDCGRGCFGEECWPTSKSAIK